MNLAARPEIDPALFRRVMGRFATGVTVVTAEEAGDVRGMTANAFMSGSLDPPLCVVSIAKRAHMHARLAAVQHMGVSILSEAQEEVSRHFAGRPAPGLRPDFVRIGGAPLLADACARIATEIVARHDCGDHTLVVGHILHMEADDRPPLLYHAGRYAALLDRRGDHDVPVPEFW